MHRAGRRFGVGLQVILLVAAFAEVAVAQIFPGRVTGTVRDIQGAVIPGAEVKLRGSAIGLERRTVTDNNGYFNFSQLPLSQYDLVVTKTGFKTWVQTGIVTATGLVTEVNVTLEVGELVSTVKVTASPPLIQSETNTTGGLLTREQVDDLPIGNRDYTRLGLLLPGAVQNSNFAFANYSINGSRARSNSWNVDGAYNTDMYRQLPSINQGGNSATAATRLPVEAIQEIQLVSSGAADVGQSSGSVMNVVLKGGTNEFHGSLYEKHRDVGLNAHNFFENVAGISKAGFVWNEFGFTAGGPVIKDRTFVFGGYDGSRLRLGTTFSSRAPTDAQIQQAISLVQSQGITPNPLGLEILKLYEPLKGPFVANSSGSQRSDNFVAKMDHHFSDSDSLSGRYLFGQGLDAFPQGGPGPGGGSQLERFFGITPIRNQNLAVSEVHVFSPVLINTLRVAYNRSRLAFTGRDSNFDPASIGLNTGVTEDNFGLPEIDIGSGPGRFANLGLNPSFPRRRTTTTTQLSDDVSYIRGRHSLKFGANWFHTNSRGFNNTFFRGLITFSGSELGNSLTSDGGVAGLVDLLAGLPTPGLTRIGRGSTRFDVSQNIIGGYFMDTFRVSSNFTVIAGLRYEFFGVPSEKRGRFSNFDPELGLVAGDQLPDGQIFDNVLTNWAPRLAIAYTPPFSIHGLRTVIRAGYGIYHDITPLDILVGQTFNIANSNPGLATNPVGGTGFFSVTPSAPIPFGPGVPIFGVGSPTPPFDIIGVDPELKPQNVQHWNLNIQQQLHPNLMLQLAYVGNKGTHLFHLLDANQPTPGNPATADQRRPLALKFPELRKVDIIRSVGNSSYNALQVSVHSQNFHGLTSQVSYTWSHNLDTGSETLDFFGTSGFVPQDSNNLRADRGNSEFDQRQALVISYVYDIPSPQPGGLQERLLGGWQISGVTTFRDGLHVPILTFGNESGTNSFHDRPNCVGPIITQLDDPTQPFVVSGLAPPPPGSFGNCPRNPVVGPGLNVWDFSVAKRTPIRERLAVEFRVDFFNLFNHPNFAEPSPDLSTRITATSDDGMFDSRFGLGGPRNIQLNLKVTW